MSGLRNYLFVFLIGSQSLVVMADNVLNNYRSGYQLYPSIAGLSDGNIAVCWGTSGSLADFPRMGIFTPDLEPLRNYDILIPEYFPLSFGHAYLDASENGFLAVGYTMYSSFDSSDINVYIRKFTDGGYSRTSDIQVNTDIVGSRRIRDVFIDDLSGVIVVAWTTLNQDTVRNFSYRLFDFDFSPISEEISILENDSEEVSHFKMAKLSSDKLMAVWHREVDPIFTEINGRYIDMDGGNPSEILEINTNTGASFYAPYITSIEGGTLVLWSGNFYGNYEASIWGRRYDENGQPLDSEEILISAPDTNGDGISDMQAGASASQDPDSRNIAVCWSQYVEGHSGLRPIIRFFNNNMQPLSDTIIVGETQGGTVFPVSLFVSPYVVFTCWDGYINEDFRIDILGLLISSPGTNISTEEVGLEGSLARVYPNPFNRQAKIEYSLSGATYATVRIYNLLGQREATLFEGIQQSGEHRIIWDASHFPSGAYFARLEAGEHSKNMKIVLLK